MTIPNPHLLTGILLAALIGPAAAGEHYDYRAAEGDSLIRIAEDLLRNPDDWRRLQRLNRIANPRRIPVGSVVRIPLEWMRSDPATGRITHVHGPVANRGAPLGASAVVRSGDEIETGEDASMTIELADGSRLTLHPRGRVKVEGLSTLRGTGQQDASLRLDSGRIESQVAPQRGPAARYRIITPTAAVGVRGTQFRVGAEGATTRAEVTEGSVAVRGGKNAIELAAGYGLVAGADATAKPVALLAAPVLAAGAALQARVVVRVPFAPVEGASAYRAQIARDAEFREVLTQAVFKSTEAKFAEVADGDYHVRVRAIDAVGLEGRDADLAFTLKARPEPPFPSFPQPQGKVRADTVGFAWTRAAEAQRYAFQLAADDSFAAPLIARDDLTEPKYVPPGKLPPADYVWRLRSIRGDGDAGPWGDAQRFQLRPPPANPEPAKIDDKSLSFSWAAEHGQDFEFQLARDAEFTRLVETRSLREPSVTLPRPDAGTYHMRVRAIDEDGFVGPYTATQTIEVPPGKPWWLLLLLIPLI